MVTNCSRSASNANIRWQELTTASRPVKMQNQLILFTKKGREKTQQEALWYVVQWSKQCTCTCLKLCGTGRQDPQASSGTKLPFLCLISYESCSILLILTKQSWATQFWQILALPRLQESPNSCKIICSAKKHRKGDTESQTALAFHWVPLTNCKHYFTIWNSISQ